MKQRRRECLAIIGQVYFVSARLQPASQLILRGLWTLNMHRVDLRDGNSRICCNFLPEPLSEANQEVFHTEDAVLNLADPSSCSGKPPQAAMRRDRKEVEKLTG